MHVEVESMSLEVLVNDEGASLSFGSGSDASFLYPQPWRHCDPWVGWFLWAEGRASMCFVSPKQAVAAGELSLLSCCTYILLLLLIFVEYRDASRFFRS